MTKRKLQVCGCVQRKRNLHPCVSSMSAFIDEIKHEKADSNEGETKTKFVSYKHLGKDQSRLEKKCCALPCACQGLLENDRKLSLNESCRCVTFKRFMMCLPLGALICLWYVPPQTYFSLLFLSPTCFLSSFAILCNFPQLGSWIHTKPLHVNDLRVLHSKKQNFLWWYTYITNALLAAVITGIIDYTFNIQKKHQSASAVEILGTLGGVLSLYLKIESVVATSLLHLTFRCKQQSNKEGRAPSGPPTAHSS